MVFVKFWRYFKVIFEVLSDKSKMESIKVNNVDDEEKAMHLDQVLELNWRWLRWIQKKEMGEMAKRSWKTMFFHFAWTCGKFAQSCEMDQKWIWLQLKGKNENWFRMAMRKFCTVLRNAPGRRNWFWCIFHCAKLLELMRNCIFPYFFGEKASGRPLRWCQVSTWPWPINRNLIYSFWERYIHFLIVEFSRFPLSIEYSTFLHFLASQTCLVRPNLQAWVAKSRFSWRMEDLEARFIVN